MVVMQYLMSWNKLEARKEQFEDIAVAAWVKNLGDNDPEGFRKALRSLAPGVFKSDKERELDSIEWVKPQTMEEYDQLLREFEDTA